MASRLVRHNDRWMIQDPAKANATAEPSIAYALALTEEELREILNDRRSSLEDQAKSVGELERRHVAAGGMRFEWPERVLTGCMIGSNSWAQPRPGFLGKLIDRVFGRRDEQ